MRRSSDVHTRSAPQLREYDAIADRIAADKPERVLDWGCGLGQVSARLLDRGLRISALDYRPDVAEEGPAPLELFPSIEAYRTSKPVELPYGDAEFDAVLSCGVLEHVHEPDASLEEIRRVLRPGGTFYVYKLPNRWSYLEKIAKALGMYWHGSLPNDRIYTTATAAELMRAHGFEVRELRRSNMLPLTLPGRVAALLAGPIWAMNRVLARIPGLNLIATNVELVAQRP